VPRKRIITSLKGSNGVPKWMCCKVAGTLMQARIDYEKELSSRGLEAEMNEQDFGEFVEDRFIEMYGLKKVAHEHLRDFIKGLKEGSDNNVRLKVFRILTGIVPGDDAANVSVSESAATFYRLALRLIIETATEDHISKLKGAAFWTHYSKMDVVKLSVLYYEKVAEKIGAVVKKLHSDVEQSKSAAERSWTARHEVDAIRGFKAFELALRDHAAGNLPEVFDFEVQGEDEFKPRVFTYGDVKAGRATAAGGKTTGPISIDAFLYRTIEHWSEFEDLEDEQVMQAFGSWDENGDGKLTLDEFSIMVKYANPNASQRKITRAFVASAGGGEYVDKERLASTLLAHGLTLTDRPEGELPTVAVGEHTDGAAAAPSEDAVGRSRLADSSRWTKAFRKIGAMMRAINGMGETGGLQSSEEELLAADLEESEVESEAGSDVQAE